MNIWRWKESSGGRYGRLPDLEKLADHKADPDDPQWAMAVEQLCPDFDQGDEFWHYDEPAPPGINAERLGLP
jgi:hypothetical protein